VPNVTDAAFVTRRKSPRRLWIGGLALVVAALVATGCGSSSPSASSSPKASPSPTKEAQISSVDACTLVTASEASAALGTTVTNLSAASGTSVAGVCAYGSQDTQATVFVYAQTFPDTTTADSISPEQMAAILNGQYGVTNAKAVTGIGDKAFEYTTTSSGNTGIAIFVFKSNAVLMIVMSPATDSSAIEKLARTAVGRL
jgi:hypothetical protein